MYTLARKLCLYGGLIFVLTVGMITTGYSDTSGLGISDDGTLGFAWSPNSERDVAGYKLYVGTLPGIYAGYVDVGLGTSYQLRDLIRGTTYYFALTAYNTSGLESDFTPELTKQIPLVITNGAFTIDPGVTNSAATNDLLGATNTLVLPEPLPLEITSIPDQSVAKNSLSDVIPFTVGGSEAPNKLEVLAVSSNPAVLPSNGLILAGSGGDYLLILDPTNGRTGTTTVTIAASDGTSSTSMSFQVIVGGELPIVNLSPPPLP